MASVTGQQGCHRQRRPRLLILNQMAGPLTWELAEDLAAKLGPLALLTGHPDTLAKESRQAIVLFPAVAYNRASNLSRATSWLAYLLQALRWLLSWPPRLPCLFFSNPPLLPWLGYLLHRWRGTPYAVMVHDIYPDVLVHLQGLPASSPVNRVWRRLNRAAYEHAAVVMTLGVCMARTLARQFDPGQTQAQRIEVMPPWADTAQIRPLPKADNWFARQYRQVGRLTVMYSGNMGLGHDLESMVAAAQRLRQVEDVHFLFIGAGPKKRLVEEYVHQGKGANATLLPWQPEEVVPYSLATAEVALVSLETGAEGLAFPSKALSAMAAGSALLGLSPTPSDLQLLIDQFQCGINVQPGDVDALVKSILLLRDNTPLLQQYRHAARAAVETHFARRNNTEKIFKKLSLLNL